MILAFIASVLIAIGILIFFMLLESKAGNKETVGLLILSGLCFFGGLFIVVHSVGLMYLIKKLIGIAIFIIGAFMLVGFPDRLGAEQESGMAQTGMFIGLILFIFGIFILLF